ncbi:hypothetical protein [Algibacter mikhailovii]|uniref:hypothetical protein n=1 Tax=Algibacter mikhailovii TaxID=425498 RepID=UPI0024940C37|nr:hypothetical protein [Algibacter mikhailovii]
MIKFFRKIRYSLFSKGETRRYLKYAFGEIALVVIGILIALQLNNWNESRKTNSEYKAVLQQIYTVIDQDSENLTLIRHQVTKQIEIIDNLVQNPENINNKLLPHLLFYLDLESSDLNSEISYLLGYLKFNPKNQKQSNLNKSLSSYGKAIRVGYSGSRKDITSFLDELNLPYPSITFTYSALNDYQNIDSTFFDDSDIKLTLKLLESSKFQNALKSSRSIKFTSLVFIDNIISLTNTNKRLIQDYYPDVKLLYSDIGLVGDATQHNNWTKNIPLTLTNESQAIWEGDIILSDGSLKFREGENWNFNWGGDAFPSGNTYSYGDDIKVKSGSYHVILNLSEKTYQFIKQNI